MLGVAMSMVVEEKQAHNIGCQPATSDDQDQHGVVDDLWLEETLNGFKNDGDAEGNEEDAIDQGAQDLGTLKLLAVRSILVVAARLSLTPYVYFESARWLAAMTAHRDMQREMTSFSWQHISISRLFEKPEKKFTMWKESATSASEWTA